MNVDDPPGFADVYDTHIRSIYAYCLRRLGPTEAHDAAADVFTAVWRRWDDRPPGDEAVLWIYGIARHVVANRTRTIRRQARLARKLIGVRSASDPGPEATAVRRTEYDEVRRAMSRLSADDQETLRLIEWEGLSRSQVAVIFGVSRAAIDQRVSRSYRRLRTLLGDEPASTPATTTIGRELT